MSDNTLTQDLAEIMKVVGYVQMDAKNDYHKYSYASANAVLTKVRDELSARGIAIKRDVEASRIVWQNETGTNVIYDWVGFFVRGDESVVFCGLGQGSDKTDKAVLKAQTAALKYALAGSFLISWGLDPESFDDEDETSGGGGSSKKRKKPAPPKKPRGATKEDAVDIKPILAKIAEAKSLDDLDKLAAAAKRLTIREQDRPALREAYTEKHKELSQ